VHPVTQKKEPTHTKRILVAVDDSPRATAVFDAGAEYARKFGAELYLFQTLTIPPEFPAAAVYSEEDQLPAHLIEIAKRQLGDIAKRAPDIAIAKTVITFGLPGQMILEEAEKLRVDLIVLGSHGYRGWDRVLGTTAATIANRSTRNVLVVHAGPSNSKKQTETRHSKL
jgi:nucleotide-binding universal stress UspA family protein